MTTQTTSGDVPTLDEFGARLALIRWRQRWNQKEAALACDLPQNSWREWEISGRAPRNLVEVAEKISRRTGVDSYWLITGRVTPSRDGGSFVTREEYSLPNDRVTRPRADAHTRLTSGEREAA